MSKRFDLAMVYNQIIVGCTIALVPETSQLAATAREEVERLSECLTTVCANINIL